MLRFEVILKVNMKYKSNFHPTEKHLSKIKDWLPKDYNDWCSITKAFKQKGFVVFTENDLVIGFSCYEISGALAYIILFQIKPDCMNKGFGRKFVNQVLNEFKKNGILVSELHCAPEESKFFWQKMGFIKFPDLKRNENRIRMYLPLVETLEQNNDIDSNNVIKLWNDHPSVATKIKPTWQWNVVRGKLEKPIILPVNTDWQISLTLNNEVIEISKLAKFSLMKNNFTDVLVIDAV